MSRTEAFIAANRFGLGASRGELGRIGADPRGWLEAQLDHAAAEPGPLSDLGASAEAFAALMRARDAGRRSPDPTAEPSAEGAAALERLIRGEFRDIYIREAAARTRAQLETEAPFRERLVAFWSNHFTVSVQRPAVLGLAGAFEREAIRPHVAGRFRDMLGAVVRHPAMLIYLDNAQSIGPNSRAGRRLGRGLNENLARELLELHTVGVDAGYSQDDVRELARILTGWSLARDGDGDAGAFRFHAVIHEPGDKTLLGKRYAEDGKDEGEAALDDLARHPATARHIATKLARHFIADQPPASAVDRLAAVFRDSDGDLGALARTLIGLDEVWREPLPKLKSAGEFVVSALRATGYKGTDEVLVASLKLLGQMPFAAPSPAGWPDSAADWIGPESLMRRTEWAITLGQRIATLVKPEPLLAETIAPVAAAATRAMIERAPSRAEAIALVFASPEFQRR